VARFKLGDTLFKAVDAVVGLLAVGLDVNVELLEARGDVFDGEGEAKDRVAVLAVAVAHGADTHGSDRYSGPEDGGKHLNHGLGDVAYLVRVTTQ
jgi:hypothetical protein